MIKNHGMNSDGDEYFTVHGRHRSCRVIAHANHSATRITENGSVHGRRYHYHRDVYAAFDAAYKWGDRKLRNS